MREEILACDKELIKRAKKAGAIGGKKNIENLSIRRYNT